MKEEELKKIYSTPEATQLKEDGKEYINSKIKTATPIWSGVDADKYVRSVRQGDYEP